MEQPATLRFIAQAYPVPKESDVIWQRCSSIGDFCQNITSDDNIVISANGLETNLTISKVTSKDFGPYRLGLSNEVDEFYTNFYIAAQG